MQVIENGIFSDAQFFVRKFTHLLIEVPSANTASSVLTEKGEALVQK